MHAANLSKDLVIKVQHLRTRTAAAMVYGEAAILQRLEGAGVRVPSLGKLIWTHEWAYLTMTCAHLPKPQARVACMAAPQPYRAVSRSLSRLLFAPAAPLSTDIHLHAEVHSVTPAAA